MACIGTHRPVRPSLQPWSHIGLLGWRCAAIAAGAAGLLAGLLGGSILLGLMLLSPFAALAFVRVGGIYAVEWTPVISHWEFRKQAKQTRFRARPEKPRPAGTLALPGDGASLRLFIEPEGGICLIHDPHRATLSADLRVSHPAYALLSPDAQRQRVSCGGERRVPRAVLGVRRAASAGGDDPRQRTGIADYYQEHGAGRRQWAEQEYEALLASSSTGASTHRTTLTLALDMGKAGAASKAAGGGLKGAAKVLRGDMAALEYVLRAADLKVGTWLGESDVAQMIRGAYDPGLGGEFLAMRPGANLEHAGPLGMDEMWDRLHHDSGWSRVLWISEWPRIEVPAHFLHSLIFAPGVRKTLCLSLRPKATSEALRQIRREKTEMVADHRQKQKIGQIQDLSDEQEYNDVLARERALISGHADVDFTGWIVVSAATETDLDAATKRSSAQPVKRPVRHGCSTAARRRRSSRQRSPWGGSRCEWCSG